MKCDVAVLGAGMVGISTALHLQARGASVALIDRRGPGEETSFGNAGIIQREGVHPYLFPRDWRRLMRTALGRGTDARYQLASLPHVAGFIWRYFRASTPQQARRTLAANIPLFERCLTEHGALIEPSEAGNLIAKGGWIALFRREERARKGEPEIAELKGMGLDVSMLTPAEFSRLEPHVATTQLAAAVHYRDPWTVSDPGALAKAYAALFAARGGKLVTADARTARRDGSLWRIDGAVEAERIVVALGPWSKPFLDALGLRLPMGIKRGYHRHYRPGPRAGLSRPVIDEEMGFVLAPMARGIRLTTGAEFAALDAPARPVQVERCLPLARQWLDIADSPDAQAWLGARPVFPDLLPAIGEAPGLAGAYLNFGHAHHGLTLGPATGRLLAEIMSGQTPFTDPAPYSAARFL